MLGFGRNRSTSDARLQSYAALIQEYLRNNDIDPAQARLNVDTGLGWSYRRGSATIEIYITQDADAGYMRVLSPMLHLPEGRLLPLYRRLLELNLELTNASLGIHQDVVYVFSERPLDGMDHVEASNIITLVAEYADRLDNELVTEFGGRLFGRSS